MDQLALHNWHASHGARFTEVNSAEVVNDYGDARAEHDALRHRAALLDLSFRSRVCLTGADRKRFLHGQVTNDVNRLGVGQGCYAALVTAKGRMESDLNIYCLEQELLLDFEPGVTAKVIQRLEQYIIADDVQVVDVAPHYGLLSVQGPEAAEVLRGAALLNSLPGHPFTFEKSHDSVLGEVYVINQPRSDRSFDIFVPTAGMQTLAEKLLSSVQAIGGGLCGWQALERARIEAGIPRFGMDMDETNLPQECGIEDRAVSYTKGCYIGQEVLNRIHTLGHVNRLLQGFRLPADLTSLPARGDKIFQDGKETGYITSAIHSPVLNENIALGYLRKEVSGPGLMVRTGSSEWPIAPIKLPR
ncbi:MAG: hypothetical protein C5B50_06970 [Verrucomicrobia bacterium]|nr:MAG: hypothetical protein C5B50_06970 [Verrucomicrobiota bacterium]